MRKFTVILCLILVLMLPSTVLAMEPSMRGNENEIVHGVENYVEGYIILATDYSRYYEIGDIQGNGVRLRSQPNFNSTVLELMYNGEIVHIYYDIMEDMRMVTNGCMFKE